MVTTANKMLDSSLGGPHFAEPVASVVVANHAVPTS